MTGGNNSSGFNQWNWDRWYTKQVEKLRSLKRWCEETGQVHRAQSIDDSLHYLHLADGYKPEGEL